MPGRYRGSESNEQCALTTGSATAIAGHAGDLRVVNVRALRGPNVAHRDPVIVAELQAGALASVKPNELPKFMARLIAALPAVAGRERAAGVPPAAASLPHSWGDALVRTALELQRMAGSPAEFGRVVVDKPEDDRWTLAIGFDEDELATEALWEGARVLRDCLRGDDPEIASTVADLTRRYHHARPGATTLALIDAARRRGIPVRRNPDDGIVQLGLGATQRRLSATMTDSTSGIATRISADKRWTTLVLERVGLEGPEGETARTVESALEIAEDLGFPVVLKPLDESSGRGTSGRIDTIEGVREAWPLARGEDDVVLVERFVDGHDHRVVVVNKRVVACAERIPGAAGSNDRTWVDRTDDMHPDNRALCELAAGAVGLDVAGLHVLTPDISVPFRANGAVVVEVNASPGIRMHTHPDRGTPRDVPGAILDMLFPPGAPTTIPVFAVTGTNGKTTTTRLIAHLFREAGRKVGYTTTDGVYFQEHLLLEGDLTGPFAANIVLSHREVELAVLETARGGILRSGLGFDQCDVGIVLNVTADHLGLRDIDTVDQLADVKAVIASVVKPAGYTVLNADDPRALVMRETTPGQPVLFTTRPLGTNPAVDAHLAAGGLLACIERDGETEHFVLRRGAERTLLGSVREVPLTFGGAARFQFENILAATVAAYTQALPADAIREGLMSFIPSSTRTPGRVNLFETERGRVIIDYAHNAAAISGLLGFLAELPATHRMALIAVPGDRRDEDMREVARLARSLDYVIFKEHEAYRRGRPAGEGARIMADALLETGFPADRVAAFAEEERALNHALTLMRPGGVVAIMADDAAAVLEQLRPYMKPKENA